MAVVSDRTKPSGKPRGYCYQCRREHQFSEGCAPEAEVMVLHKGERVCLFCGRVFKFRANQQYCTLRHQEIASMDRKNARRRKDGDRGDG